MASLSKQPENVLFRLIKRPVEAEASLAIKKPRLKTGDNFVLRRLTPSKDKIQTNDEIHQSIELCPVMKALVDTEAFQRLRNIKQLGTSEFLYVCANGNRFSHSLGVAHLAERMCKSIKEEQPNLGATDKDVLCVKLAGLLHDLGHGPYSHLYEIFRHEALPNYLKAHPDLEACYSDCQDLKVPDNWSHELSSLQMIDAALAELGLEIDLHNLDRPLRQIGDGVDANTMRVFKPQCVEDPVLTSRDLVFIKECILGKPLPEVESRSFIGRQEARLEWLYDIVNNRHSGLDVDKIDYFARDCLRAFGNKDEAFKLITDARVAKGKCSRTPDQCPRCCDTPGFHYMICYPTKRVIPVMAFFKKRLELHESIYQNKKTVAVESLICDILCSADPFLRLKTYTGESFPLSRAVMKSEFLLRLDDSILHVIEHSTDPNLAEARVLIQRFRRHDMYKCAGDQILDIESERFGSRFALDDEDQMLHDSCERDKRVWEMECREIQEAMLREKDYWENAASAFPLERKDFIIRKYQMHHGRKHANPLLYVRFFDGINEKLVGSLENLPLAVPAKLQHYRCIIPSSFQKVGVRVFVREESKKDLVNQVFLQWYERMLLGGDAEAEITPTVKLQFLEGEDSDDDDGNRHQHQPVCLSQESVEEEDSRDADFDPSPIAVRRRR